MTPKSPKRYKLSILICTLESRKAMFNQLMVSLKAQKTSEVEILHECDNKELSIGEKRNKLLKRATGDYVAFIDDDDWIDNRYVELILKALKGKPDCVNLIGIMSTNGRNERRFEHSIKYFNYFELNTIYCRPPNHLNAIKRSIALKFKFPEINMGEDTDWAMQISRSMLLQKEAVIDIPIYHYRFVTK